MTSGTNFSGARTATLNAATDLFGSGSAQYNAIATGWCAVGVGTCPGGGTPTPTPTATPTPGGGSELLVNGGFEGSASPWVGSGTGYFYVNPGNYPHGGTGYIYFGVNNSVSGQSYQQVTIPSTATANADVLAQRHIERDDHDDAVRQAVRRGAEHRGHAAGDARDVQQPEQGDGRIYSQKSFSLAAYRGQTVRVQFRSTTDSSVTTTFRVDDVSLK